MTKLSLRQLALMMTATTLLALGAISGISFLVNNTQPANAAALQQDGTSDPLAYSISVNGRGMAGIAPDIVDIQLGLETVDGNAQQAITQNTDRMAAITGAIKNLDVEDKDIQTTVYNVWIEQVYNPADGRPTGELRYHVINIVTVRLRDVARTGELLQAVSQAGANRIDSVTFGVSDPTALQSQARERAVADAKAKAEQLANALGVKVGTVRQIVEYTTGPVAEEARANKAMAFDMAQAAGSAVPISEGAFNVTIDVQIVFDIQR